MPHGVPLFAAWANFYVVAGSAAAALMGLTFVVVTLAVSHSDQNASERSEGFAAFMTPTIVQFGAALLVAALACVPWPAVACAGVAIGIVGLIGCVYTASIAFRLARMTMYRPDVSDWTWYVALPPLAFALVLAGGATLPALGVPAAFGIAAGTVGLIVVGIHNAWDVVTYLAISVARED